MPRMCKYIRQMNDPVIGDYFVCQNCKHFMLSKQTAVLHRGCKEKMFKTFEPKEQSYLCSTCGRFFDNREQFVNHENVHKVIGDYDPTKFVARTF